MTQIETNNEIEDKKSLNFIEQIVEADLKAGKNGGRLNTRFPPEPNGYLHIGHAKAICMDFGIAEKFGGTCNLRFDDTNPVKEDVEYVDSIMEDIHWLGFDWGDRLYYASDYFPKLWDLAIRLIKEGKAYVDEQSSEEIARQKGTPTQPGIESPYRNRSVEENLQLFEEMKNGKYADGEKVLRAKRANSRKAVLSCARKSTWLLPICTSAILSCTVLSSILIIVPERNGMYIPCMISHMGNRIISKG